MPSGFSRCRSAARDNSSGRLITSSMKPASAGSKRLTISSSMSCENRATIFLLTVSSRPWVFISCSSIDGISRRSFRHTVCILRKSPPRRAAASSRRGELMGRCREGLDGSCATSHPSSAPREKASTIAATAFSLNCRARRLPALSRSGDSCSRRRNSIPLA